MSLQVLVVDDEPLARLRLRTLLGDCNSPAASVTGEAGNAAQATDLLHRVTVDAVLLDIRMPGADGLTLARTLSALPRPPAVIFVTAHAEHAVAAFELEAIDYLTKPVRLERLQAALQKVERHIQARAGGAPLPPPEVLLIQDRGRTERVPLDEILYFKAELKYITVRTAARSYILDASLSELEERHAARFMRVHRNALVARHAVRALEKHFDPEEGEGWAVRLTGVTELLTVSRRQLTAVREAIISLGGPGRASSRWRCILSSVNTSAREPAEAPILKGDDEPPRVLLHMPVDVRSVSLAILATIASLAVLRWASAFFIPLMIGLMFSYALSPLVDYAERWRLPRTLSAGALILALLGAAGGSIYAFADDTTQLLNSLPEAAVKLRDAVRSKTGRNETPLGTVQKAATQLEQAAEEAGPATQAQRGVQRVVIEKPRFNIRDHLWTGTLGLVAVIGQVVLVTFLTYFLLLSGDTFRRKLVKIAGPSFATKKITVEALNEITGQIQRYLLVQLLTSAGVGLVTGLAFFALGLKHAVVWALAAGILNLVPYIGSAVIAGAAALVAFLQFGTLEMAAAVAGASLVIHTISGNLVVPWLTSKASRMNAVTVFIGVLAWGWLWGVWGLLLGIPILMVVKAICDRVEDLKPIGELLGD